MKTSLIVPCVPHHFAGLANILRYYHAGTSIPDEVVVSLSNSHLISNELIERFKSEMSNLFKDFILLEHNVKMTHGPNRQAASNVSTGEILVYADADDIPHFKKIETTKYFFENFDILHLNHWWCRENAEFTDFSIEDVQYASADELSKHYFTDCNLSELRSRHVGGYGQAFGRTHGGHTSVRRKVLEKVRWKDWHELFGPAEDWEFCFETAFYFRKSMILKLDLIKYISEAPKTFPQEVYKDNSPAARQKR